MKSLKELAAEFSKKIVDRSDLSSEYAKFELPPSFTGMVLGPKILALLGIPSEGVRGVEVRCHVDEAAVIKIERYLTKDELEKLKQ